MKQMILSLFFLAILELMTACTPSWPPLSKVSIQVSSSCNSTTTPATCSVKLVNDPRSPQAFNWKVVVQPSDIHFGISSGTITPGGSNEIDFQALHKQCPVNMTFTGSDGTVVKTGNINC
jgi:hypothetical protein